MVVSMAWVQCYLFGRLLRLVTGMYIVGCVFPILCSAFCRLAHSRKLAWTWTWIDLMTLSSTSCRNILLTYDGAVRLCKLIHDVWLNASVGLHWYMLLNLWVRSNSHHFCSMPAVAYLTRGEPPIPH